jgi:chorismate synthase
MGSMWGNTIKISVFGESHGPAVGAVIDGLPSGISLDTDVVAAMMARRAAAGKALATPRKEPDAVEILSGLFNGYTTGTPLTGMITNTNTRSGDYEKDKPRPGHADYTAQVRYDGFQDYRGGGHFSGRLTAPLVFAGAVCLQALAQLYPGVRIGSRITALGGVADASAVAPGDYAALTYADADFPVLDVKAGEAMKAAVACAREAGDSVGGVIEGYVTGLRAGVGDPIFDTMESRLSSLLFAVPAVKGVEFGDGFAMTGSKGSQMNDAFYMDGERVATRTNHNGGINGGITNGMPVVFRVAVKPTPSIALPQETVDMARRAPATLAVKGRHDPCIALRACPVIEAAAALCILDSLMGAEKWKRSADK